MKIMTSYYITSIWLLLLFAAATQCIQIAEDPNAQQQFDPEGKLEKIKITAEPSVTSRGALGQGFEIHKEDLLTKQFKATGATIFKDLPIDECIKTAKYGAIQKDDSFYSSTKSLYQAISTNTKVSGSLQGTYTLGASVDAVTNNIASGESEVQGLSLNLKAYSMSSELTKDCINEKPLVQDIVEAFEALPSKVDQPWKLSSWRDYKVFLSKFGSHFVQESISGSSIYQYVFAKSDKKFSQKDFTVKACVSLAGPTQAGKAEISACAGVTKKDIEKSSSQSMVKKLVVRGGKAETRAELSGALTADQIKKFLKEAETDPSPIQYYFYPIWDIFKERYLRKADHYAKAANLEQFYKGYLHFGCSYKRTINNKEIQKFVLSSQSDPSSPTYVCKLGPEGCHVDNDCHYEHAFWCSCSGDSCLRYKDTQLKAGGVKKEAYAFKGSRWGWQGCKYWLFKGCYCSEPRTYWTSAWRGDDLKKLQKDVPSMLLKKRRDQAKRHRLHCKA